ncbi:MAG: sulfatase-like hydrolase/transferase [Chitinophagaceae bacterium]
MSLPKNSVIIIVTLIAWFGSSYAQVQSPGSPGTFKNIIFIVGDDHSSRVLGAYGNKIIRTPNLDRMAQRGVLFENAFVSSPLCSPSRQSILTGKYPHATGVSILKSAFPEEQVTIADYLTPQGFKTAIIGKNHFNNNFNHGFELKVERKDYEKHLVSNPPRKLPDSVKVRSQWKPFVDPANIWLNADGLPSSQYDKEQAGTYYANRAIEFIQGSKDGRFLLWIGFEEPHSPFNFPVEYAKKYDAKSISLPQGSPEDDRWVPKIFKNLTDEEKKGITASYYSSVEFLDKNIGLVLDVVEKAGLAHNTLIIYLGDNGYQLNDHKRFEKHTMWEQSVRVPLIIQAGNKFGKNRRVQALTSFVDLVPTALDALGVTSMPTAQGRSFLPLLKEQTKQYRDFIFSEYLEDNKAMVRTAKWKYVFTSGKHDLALGYATGNPAPGILHFLYDEVNDPKETHNLASAVNNKSILLDLQRKMISVFEQTHPKGKLPNNLSMDEKLVIYCEPPELEVKGL